MRYCNLQYGLMRLESEIRTAVGKLKNNKSSFSDKIKNEMIKSSLNELMPVYLKLFNTVLDLTI